MSGNSVCRSLLIQKDCNRFFLEKSQELFISEDENRHM